MGKLLLSTILILIICFHLSMVSNAVAQTAELSAPRQEGPYVDLVTRFSPFKIAFSCHNRNHPNQRQVTLSVFIPKSFWGNSYGVGKAILREALPQEGVKEYRAIVEVLSSRTEQGVASASFKMNWQPAQMIKTVVPVVVSEKSFLDDREPHSEGEVSFDLKTQDEVIDPREHLRAIKDNTLAHSNSNVASLFTIVQAAQAQYERKQKEMYYFPLRSASLKMIDTVTRISSGSFQLQCWMNKLSVD